MLGPAVTSFSETAALYAILNEDTEEAERIVSAKTIGARLAPLMD
ncbi:hypothetical protein ACFXKG_18825 [Streptomyces sp. NPDC059255]